MCIEVTESSHRVCVCKEVAWSSQYVLYGVIVYVCTAGRVKGQSQYQYMPDLKELTSRRPLLCQWDGCRDGCRVSTPLVREAWESRLQEHPDRNFRGYLVIGMTQVALPVLRLMQISLSKHCLSSRAPRGSKSVPGEGKGGWTGSGSSTDGMVGEHAS